MRFSSRLYKLAESYSSEVTLLTDADAGFTVVQGPLGRRIPFQRRLQAWEQLRTSLPFPTAMADSRDTSDVRFAQLSFVLIPRIVENWRKRLMPMLRTLIHPRRLRALVQPAEYIEREYRSQRASEIVD
jgi:hypothetical protein